jgi:hypothetical protein
MAYTPEQKRVRNERRHLRAAKRRDADPAYRADTNRKKDRRTLRANDASRQTAYSAGKPWSTEEISALRDVTKCARDVAAQLGRSIVAVRLARLRLQRRENIGSIVPPSTRKHARST